MFFFKFCGFLFKADAKLKHETQRANARFAAHVKVSEDKIRELTKRYVSLDNRTQDEIREIKSVSETEKNQLKMNLTKLEQDRKALGAAKTSAEACLATTNAQVFRLFLKKF